MNNWTLVERLMVASLMLQTLYDVHKRGVPLDADQINDAQTIHDWCLQQTLKELTSALHAGKTEQELVSEVTLRIARRMMTMEATREYH